MSISLFPSMYVENIFIVKNIKKPEVGKGDSFGDTLSESVQGAGCGGAEPRDQAGKGRQCRSCG